MQKMKVAEIKPNPSNPRVIRDEKLEQLKKSITDFPEMLEARPLVVDPDGVVLGGNMRLKALSELGIEETPVYKATWDQVKNKEFIIKDNVAFGDWDWEVLHGEDWDTKQLSEWGMDIWSDEDDLEDLFDDTEPQPQVDNSGHLTFKLSEAQKDKVLKKLSEVNAYDKEAALLEVLGL